MIYFVRAGDNGPIKIGTTIDVGMRLKTFQTIIYNITLLGVIEGGRSEEKSLHEQFSTIRLSGEWFQDTPELLEFINENTVSLDQLKQDKQPEQDEQPQEYTPEQIVQLVNIEKETIIETILQGEITVTRASTREEVKSLRFSPAESERLRLALSRTASLIRHFTEEEEEKKPYQINPKDIWQACRACAYTLSRINLEIDKELLTELSQAKDTLWRIYLEELAKELECVVPE